MQCAECEIPLEMAKTNTDVGVPCFGNILESSPADMARRCEEETSKTSSYRLCHLVKWKHFQGYGFTVDSDNSGHYISTVVETSPADAAGLRHGNKVIAINGVSVESESYGGVIERILSSKEEIQILVDDNVAPAPKKTDDVTINLGIHEGGTNQNSVPTRKSADEAREFGVGFAVRNSLLWKIDPYQQGNGRLLFLCLHTGPVSMISVYAPTLNTTADTKEEFYDELNSLIDKITKEQCYNYWATSKLWWVLTMTFGLPVLASLALER